jgi:thiol-disulfide isomerase/thioredoxin
MSQKISIILTRANWCPHCQHFEPIFENAKKLYKKHDYLKDFEIGFEDYDLANNDIKNTFMLNHNDIKDKIQGYPTVFVNLKNKTSKQNDYFTIEHTVIDNDDNIDVSKQIEQASMNFLLNITNGLKSFNSENKVLFIQKGGYNLSRENKFNQCGIGGSFLDLKNKDIYKEKYLKYKSKYIELKNSLNKI